ncbi:MAG: S8 family serine peptidase [Bacteroidetes bacterium]|nr:S8 family serine peptidase [Bacteroidota bacterium]
MQAQTLVNKVNEEHTLAGTITVDFVSSTRDSAGYVYVAGNTLTLPSQHEDAIVRKYQAGTGTLIWEYVYNDISDLSDFAMGVYVHGGYVYITGTSVDLTTSESTIYTVILDPADGSEVDVIKYTPDYGGYAVASSVKADNVGRFFVCGTEQNGANDFQVFVIAYDLVNGELWRTYYDSSGRYDGAVSMKYNSKGELIIVGYSGTAFSSWDFVTLKVYPGDGSITDTVYSSNGNGNLSRPVDFTTDFVGDLYVLGQTAISPTNTDWKLIKYDTLFNEVWVRTWGSADSLEDKPVSIAADHAGHLVVTGFTSKSDGSTDATTVRFNRNGSTIWQRSIAALTAGEDAKAADLVLAAIPDTDFYITGSSHRQGDEDMFTAKYDINGNLKWLKYFNDTTACQDHARDIQIDGSGLIYSSGSVTTPTDTGFVTVVYEDFELGKELAYDSLGNPLYVKGQILVKFDSSVVIQSAINNPELKFGNAQRFLKQWAIDSITKYLPFTYRDILLTKIHTNLKTSDTISMSRLGERVSIPDFWASFIFSFPTQNITEKRLCDTLINVFPIVEYAQLDQIATLCSFPNDPLYNDQQSLHPVNYTGVDINIEQAWHYTNGKDYIKVGIFDTGILSTHQDFCGAYDWGGLGQINPTVKDGWDYVYDIPLGTGGLLNDIGGHGTAVAGIIGAGTNNGNGVAGIAGGDSLNDSGVSLHGFRLMTQPLYQGGPDSLATAHQIIKGIVETSTQSLDSSFGYGMHVLNQSFVFNSSAILNGYFIDSNWAMIVDAYHYANRNKMIIPSGAGNDGGLIDINEPYVYYPAAIDDKWLIAVGGTGNNGEWTGTHPDDEFTANFGKELDVSAPAVRLLVYTDSVGSNPLQYPTGRFGSFNGTSAATAHVSGVAALLLSYLNDTVSGYRNLAPEDVEHIIELSAFDIDSPGYDIFTGYGRLNAGAALYVVDTAHRKLVHYDSDSIMNTKSVSIAFSDSILLLAESSKVASNTVIQKGIYKCNAFKITSTLTLPLAASDTLVDIWPRHSSSTLYGKYGGKLIPREEIYIESAASNQAVVAGYIYQLYDTSGTNLIGWLPFDTSSIFAANFAITALIGDSIIRNWDTLILSNPAANNTEMRFYMYPNPSFNTVTVEISGGCMSESVISVSAFDGKTVLKLNIEPTNGQHKRLFLNTEHLSEGVYMINYQSDCGNDYKKLIKLTK